MRAMGLSQEELRRRAENDPSAVVMEPTYDNVFEPWPRAKIEACMVQVRALVKTRPTEVATRVEADETLREFARLHPRLYTLVSDAVYDHTPVIRHLLDTREQLASGHITQAQACTAVSDRALEAAMAKSPPGTRQRT